MCYCEEPECSLERSGLKQKFPVMLDTTLTTSIEKPSKDTKDEEAQQFMHQDKQYRVRDVETIRVARNQ